MCIPAGMGDAAQGSTSVGWGGEEFENMALLSTPCSLLGEELGGVNLERKTQYTMMISFSLSLKRDSIFSAVCVP